MQAILSSLDQLSNKYWLSIRIFSLLYTDRKRRSTLKRIVEALVVGHALINGALIINACRYMYDMRNSN